MHCGGWSLISFTQIKLVISAYSAERKWLAKSIITFKVLSSLLSANFNFTWKNALISTQRLFELNETAKWKCSAKVSHALFRQITRESDVLHYLLPVKRDAEVAGRLRSTKKYPTVRARTSRYKNSFIPYELFNFQWHFHVCLFVYSHCVNVCLVLIQPLGCQNPINVMLLSLGRPTNVTYNMSIGTLNQGCQNSVILRMQNFAQNWPSRAELTKQL